MSRKFNFTLEQAMEVDIDELVQYIPRRNSKGQYVAGQRDYVVDMSKLREYSRVLVDVANKRIKRLKKAISTMQQKGEYVRTYDYENKQLYTTSTKMNSIQLLEQFQEMRSFLSRKTSTVKGLKKVSKREEDLFHKIFGETSTETEPYVDTETGEVKDRISDFWGLYTQIKEDYFSSSRWEGDSEQILEAFMLVYDRNIEYSHVNNYNEIVAKMRSILIDGEKPVNDYFNDDTENPFIM